MTTQSINQIMPIVGMGATIHYYTDTDAATVVEVSKSGKRAKIQKDNAKRIDKNGQSESQKYEYSPNSQSPIQAIYLASDGNWKLLGAGNRVTLGERRKYRDPSY